MKIRIRCKRRANQYEPANQAFILPPCHVVLSMEICAISRAFSSVVQKVHMNKGMGS